MLKTKEGEEFLPIKSYSVGSLFSTAKQAYQKTIGGKSDREPDKQDALIAIIFSALSLEAFINALADLATDRLTEPHSEIETAFANLMEEVENTKGATLLKFMLARFIFSGKMYKKDENPFQDFKNLLALRNALVHMKPAEELGITLDGHFVRVKEPKALKALPKNILAKYEKNKGIKWTSMISTQASARWACNTAVETVHSILDVIPDSLFKKYADILYAEIFQTVE
ncbi:MAG: hypothetical protein LC099_12240 [Anaerolineales bacterium]|nr:hypothetical protein [Anaerolineales bacterium]